MSLPVRCDNVVSISRRRHGVASWKRGSKGELVWSRWVSKVAGAEFRRSCRMWCHVPVMRTSTGTFYRADMQFE